jgi:hypothetical protein
VYSRARREAIKYLLIGAMSRKKLRLEDLAIAANQGSCFASGLILMAGFATNCTSSAISNFTTVSNAGLASLVNVLIRLSRRIAALRENRVMPWARTMLPIARVMRNGSSVDRATLR